MPPNHLRLTGAIKESIRYPFETQLWWLKKSKTEQQQEQEKTSENAIVNCLAGILQTFGVLDHIEVEPCIIYGQDYFFEDAPGHDLEDWREAWKQGGRACRIILKALGRSRATVGSLSIYNQVRIGVTPQDIAASIQWLRESNSPHACDLKHACSIKIKHLTLRIGIGSSVITEEYKHITAAAELLKAMPNLEGFAISCMRGSRLVLT